jgi:hypothetical protein
MPRTAGGADYSRHTRAPLDGGARFEPTLARMRATASLIGNRLRAQLGVRAEER